MKYRRYEIMTTRRNLLIGGASLATLAAFQASAEEAGNGLTLSPEGLLTQPWFLESLMPWHCGCLAASFSIRLQVGSDEPSSTK